MKSRMKKRTSPLQTVEEDKVCISTKVERHEIVAKSQDSMNQETTIHQRNKTKNKKKINKFKDEELNQKYELLPKKARKAPFGRCYFAVHRDSQNVVLIAMIFQKVFNQYLQGGGGEAELHKLIIEADPNLSGFREKIQCSGAVALVMDITSNKTISSETIAEKGSSSSSQSQQVAPTTENADSTRADMTTPASKSKLEAKPRKTNRNRKRVEEKESRSQTSSRAESKSKQGTNSSQEEVKLNSPISASISKESMLQEKSANQVEAQDSSWANWFMPWTSTPKPKENLFQQASEREFFQAETASAGPYDNMKKQEQKAIQSNYYQGEAWSVVSPGYSDCDVSSRVAPSIIGSTLMSTTHDSEDLLKRKQSIQKIVREKVQCDRRDDEIYDDEEDDDDNDEREEETVESKEEHEPIVHRRIDPEGSHQVDPSFSAKPKEVESTDDEPTEEDTRISIAAALERSRKARRKDVPLNTQEKVEKEAAPSPISTPLETEKVETNEQKEARSEKSESRGRTVERDALSRVSTDAMTVYSADYSSVSPYRLMRPANLTFCNLITSLELADCMPLGAAYDYNVDYDEIFADEEFSTS